MRTEKLIMSTRPDIQIEDADGFVCVGQVAIYPDGLRQRWVKWIEGEKPISEWRPVPVIPEEMCPPR